MSEGFRFEEIAACLEPAERARWLPSRAYTDPGIAALEHERIGRPGWHCIGVADKLKKAGDYVATRLMGQRVLVAKGKDGEIRAFRNVCLHRGMWLAKGEGNASSFTCPYHCWNYDLAGQLLHAPGMNWTEGFDEAGMRLKPVRLEIWHGFLMATLDEAAEPFHRTLQARELGAIIAPWNIADLEVMIEKKYDISDWNWKIMLENGMEGYHVMGTHAKSGEPIIPVKRLKILRSTEEAVASGWTDLWHGYSDEWLKIFMGPPVVPWNPPALRGLPDWAFTDSVFLMTFAGAPTFSLGPEGVISYMTERGDDGKTLLVWRHHLPSTLRQWEGFEAFIEWKSEWIDTIQSEDDEACRGAMEGLTSSAWEPTQYSYLERSIYHFHQWYLSKMGFDDAVQAVRHDKEHALVNAGKDYIRDRSRLVQSIKGSFVAA